MEWKTNRVMVRSRSRSRINQQQTLELNQGPATCVPLLATISEPLKRTSMIRISSIRSAAIIAGGLTDYGSISRITKRSPVIRVQAFKLSCCLLGSCVKFSPLAATVRVLEIDRIIIAGGKGVLSPAAEVGIFRDDKELLGSTLSTSQEERSKRKSSPMSYGSSVGEKVDSWLSKRKLRRMSCGSSVERNIWAAAFPLVSKCY
ncbi:unnamed protein product [Linum tenue]|uniref:Uncharacterized protein n=1 Tax=Linum tenue TaxID=586396 RepID=A0AAV0ICQ5_9ROSI|nr:unnamed protein product [Linum tenue]